MKTLLIVYHTRGVKSAQLAEAVERAAIASVERGVTGLRLKKVREPILALHEVTPGTLAQCDERGALLAAGLAAGVF